MVHIIYDSGHKCIVPHTVTQEPKKAEEGQKARTDQDYLANPSPAGDPRRGITFGNIM